MSTKSQQLDAITRRSFVRRSGGCAALTSTSLLSTLLNLELTNSAVANQEVDGYKALVCFFLYGGNDSFNMLTPYEDSEHSVFIDKRGGVANADGTSGGLAIPKDQLLQIQDKNGRSYGLHPEMSPLKSVYDEGKLAFVANVGSLVRPITRFEYNKGVGRPLGLYSHSDLVQHWQSSIPQSRSAITGWAGRMADIIMAKYENDGLVSMNIALNGSNRLQTGSEVTPYVVGTGGATQLGDYVTGGGNRRQKIYSRITDGVLSQTYADILEKAYSESKRDAIDSAIAYNQATSAVELATNFADNINIAQQFKRVAQTIGARDQLGQCRQIFFVSLGGWDHHDVLIPGQAIKLMEVSSAMKSFWDEMKAQGVENDVTVFTASDFGRTLSSNGDGSDHAWGGNHMVMGGSVNGGDILGKYPVFDSSGLQDSDVGDIDTGRGRLIPTTGVDEYSSELAQWYAGDKLNANDMAEILPNLNNFDGRPPLNIFS